jgi:hypothetical protein
MDKTELIDDINKKIPNIISHFRFLCPITTTAEEKAVLDKGKLVVEDLGDNRFGLKFFLPDYLFLEITASISTIEESLMRKSALVFKYFEGAQVLYVKVHQNQEATLT